MTCPSFSDYSYCDFLKAGNQNRVGIDVIFLSLFVENLSSFFFFKYDTYIEGFLGLSLRNEKFLFNYVLSFFS